MSDNISKSVNNKSKPKSTISSPAKKNIADWKTKYFFYSQKALPKASLDLLAENLIESLYSNPNIDTLDELFILNSTCSRSVEGYRKDNENVAQAYDFCKFLLATRREKNALNRKIDPNIFKFNQYQYSKDWAEAEKHHAELKNMYQEEQNKNTIVVVPSLDELKKMVNDEPKHNNSK